MKKSNKQSRKETVFMFSAAAILILCSAIITTLMMRTNKRRTVAEAKSKVTEITVPATTTSKAVTTTTATTFASTTTSASSSTTITTTSTAPAVFTETFLVLTKAPETSAQTETTTSETTVQVTINQTAASAVVTETSETAISEKTEVTKVTKAATNCKSVTFRGKTFSTSIKEMNLSGVQLQKTDLPELKELTAKFQNLKKINLCDCGLSNETLAAFQKELDGIRVVWRVKLGTQWSLRTDAVAFSVLIMNYKHVRMTSADLEVLKYCPDLLALDLGQQALTDLSKIAKYLPDLRLLIIADNRVSDLSPLAKLKHLHYLEIFVNRVKDLSPLASLRELVDVNISYNPISDITPLLNSPMMQRVWLESTKVNQSGVDLLRETYPNAKVVNIGKGSVDQGWRWGNARYEQMMHMWYNNYYGSEFQKYDDLAVTLGLRG